MVKYVEIESKTLLTTHKYRDNWFWQRYSINPFRGCEFNCSYCDAITEKYLIHGDHRDFSSTIYVKKNAPKILKREIGKFKPDVVGISGVTDPYQPAEKNYELTRDILKILDRYNFPVHILTKSDLILRDMDLLKRISKNTWCTVSFTITSFDRDICNLLEESAPSPLKRLEAIRLLNEEGIPAGVNFMPITPYILDSPENLKDVIKKSSRYAKYILIGSGMSLRSNQKIRFTELLEKNFPELLGKYIQLYRNRQDPSRNYILNLNELALNICKKYGIKNYIDPPLFRRKSEQRTLIPTEDYDILNREVANHLLQLAFFMEYTGDYNSTWKYHLAAERIEKLSESILDIYEKGDLEKLEGVEKSISREIIIFLTKKQV